MGNQKAKRIKLDDVQDLIALDDFIIVEAHESESMTKGGIVIPDTAQKNSWRGTVVAVGPGKYDAQGHRLPIEVEIGDIVIYRNFLGWLLAEINGRKYYAVSGEERIARLPRAKARYES